MGSFDALPLALATPDGPPEWLPWPQSSPPDLRLAQALRHYDKGIALLGHVHGGPRGRYGVVGLAAATGTLEPGLGTLRHLVETRPADTLRVALLGYELGRPLVHLPATAAPADQPQGLWADLGAFLLVDHVTQRMAWGGPDHASRKQLMDALAAPAPLLPAPAAVTFDPAVDDATHARRLRAVLDAIAAGDIYQANLTRQLHVRGPLDGLAALTALARHNPVPHAAWLRVGPVELVSSTMETLLHYDAGSREACSFPIKGTRARTDSGNDEATPRGTYPKEQAETLRPAPKEQAQARALRADPKEQAEHVMIVDLVRHDLGRLATPGSVSVPTFMGIEPYRALWHAVSTIRARIPAPYHAGHLLDVLFPGGSIVGAPKRRAMDLLHLIEATPRGFYTGALGLLTPRGDAHFSILIRTLVRDCDGWHLGVGGGIVADSRPARELMEMNEKIAVFRTALGASAA